MIFAPSFPLLSASHSHGRWPAGRDVATGSVREGRRKKNCVESKVVGDGGFPPKANKVLAVGGGGGGRGMGMRRRLKETALNRGA